MMTRAQKIEVGNTVSKIVGGDFSLNDVKALFIDLRQYAAEDTAFMEYADFVAHPERDRGLIKQALEYFADKAHFARHYIIGEQNFDPQESFPAYIKRMFSYIIPRIDPRVSKKFRLRQADYRSFVRQHVLDLPDSDQCELSASTKKRISKNELVPELHVLYGCISGMDDPPAMHQDQVIKSLISVLKRNKVLFNEKGLLAQSDKITLLILAHLHRSEYKLRDGSVVKIYIKGMEYRIENKGDMQVAKSKFLHLAAFLPSDDFEIDDVKIPWMIMPTLMNTKLGAFAWCSEEVFVDFGDVKGGISDHEFEVKEFKLHPILPYEGAGVVDVTFPFPV